MKKLFVLICVFVFTGVMCFAGQRQQKKDDVEIIREFKNNIKNNLYLDFRDKAEALKDIDKDILKKHQVYKSFMKIIVNKDKKHFVIMRKVAIEMVLYYQSVSHRVPNLESELLSVMVDKKEAMQIRMFLIEKLPEAISVDDTVNLHELKRAFLKIISKKIKYKDDARLLDLKQAVFRKLSYIDVSYKLIHTHIKRELNDKKSRLKVSILYFLLDYSLINASFDEFEIKRFCKKVFKNQDKEFSTLDIANALKLYGNMLKNGDEKIQSSDEEIFLKHLKNNNEDILIAAAESLYKVKSTKSVSALIDRLKEVDTKSLRARNSLILSLGYLEGNLLRMGIKNNSLSRIALEDIRDVFLLILPKIKVKDPVLRKVLDAIDMFGAEGKAENHMNFKSLKKLIKYMGKSKEEKIKKKVASILTNFTGMPFGSSAELWARWLKAEESNPRSKFN